MANPDNSMGKTPRSAAEDAITQRVKDGRFKRRLAAAAGITLGFLGGADIVPQEVALPTALVASVGGFVERRRVRRDLAWIVREYGMAVNDFSDPANPKAAPPVSPMDVLAPGIPPFSGWAGGSIAAMGSAMKDVAVTGFGATAALGAGILSEANGVIEDQRLTDAYLRQLNQVDGNK